MEAEAVGEGQLVIAGERFEPGDQIRGRVGSARHVHAVDLVRVEASPTSTLEFTAASVEVLADGSFALNVPADAPPSVQGRYCSLVWRLRVRTRELPQHADARRTLEIACRL
jgi:hypothetical protein